MTHRSLTRTETQCLYACDELIDALISALQTYVIFCVVCIEETVQPKDGQTQLLRFSSNDIPERDRVECFREVFARTILNIDMEPLHGVPIDVEMSLHGIDGFGLAMGRLSPMRNRHIASTAADDDLILVALLDGQGTVAQCSRQLDVGKGEAVLTTNYESGTFTGHSATRLVNLRLRRTALEARGVDVDSVLVRSIPRDTAALNLLVNYAGVVADDDALATAEMQRLVVDHLHDLASLTLAGAGAGAPTRPMRGVRAARLRAIKKDVRASIGAHDLRIADVASRHGVTPRYIQMLFEQAGTTFSEFVLAERLLLAHQMLIDPGRGHLKVSEIAFAAGFSDLSYFNRRFRQRFGDTPSGVRPDRS